MTFRLGRIPFALTALFALLVGVFGSGTRVAGAPVRIALAAAAVKASPAKLTFDAVGPDHVKPFVLSTNASGLKASVTDPAICSVAPSAVPTDPNSRTFVVTPLAAGTTTVTVVDASGAAIATITVTVAIAGATPVAAAPPPNNTGLFAGAGAALIGIIALISHGGGGSASVAAPTTPPVVTPSPVPAESPTPAATASATAVGVTPTPTATPVSSPSAPATQTPIPATPTPGPLKVNPTSFSFVIGQSPATGTFTATEAGYTGSFTASTANTSDATVSPSSAQGPSANFVVTPVGAGTTLITVTDTMGNQATVTVTVTQTSVIVNRRSPRATRTTAPPRAPQHRSP